VIDKVHVVGAGLAGLSAATLLAERGVSVIVSEAAGQAGGRCRSYIDPQLDMMIDNGNHLVLSGNRAVMAYLKRLGTQDRLAGPDSADLAFMDLRDGTRWRLRPNDGPLAWWVFARDRRVPETGPADYLPLAALLVRHPGKRIDEVLKPGGVLWERLLQPFFLAALNTEAAAGSADLAGAVVRETLAKGGQACRPRIAQPTLSGAFVEPALDYLAVRGAPVRLGRRLKTIVDDGHKITALEFGDGTAPVGSDDAVILAVPPNHAQALLPGLQAPDEFRSIVNGHFALPASERPARAPLMTGLIGGAAEWLFVFEDRVSVTVSAADGIVDDHREHLAARLWADVARVLDLDGKPMPPWQIVKERRATFAATPEQDAKRPGARTGLSNLFLAGDWTRTGLPATIEGALRSGETAARLVL
jgi:squalene-associated FAD-dependent desaturase